VRNEGYPPLSIFAEATTTNGTRIIPFKRGAFQGMRTITPCFFEMSETMISPAYDIIMLIQQQILLLSALSLRKATLNIMPEFTPTPFMLEKFADKDRGGGPWSIYAWCLREAISKQSGIPVLDEKLSLQDKMAFMGLMNGWSDRVEINGQLFEYKGDKPVQDVTISKMSQIRRKSTVTY